MKAEKIKICYLVSSLCNEGPVNVLFNTVKHIDYSRFEVSIITLIPEKKTTRIEDFYAFPIKIYQLTTKKRLSVFKLFLELKKKVRKLKPDVLHSHCSRSLYLKCFIHGPFKKAYTIHNYPGELQRILYGKRKGNIVIMLNHFFTSRIDLPVACAESISEMYKDKFNWNVLSIPNGSSFPVIYKTEGKQKEIREKLSLNPEKKYFISIGRFSKEKKHELIIQAFEKMANEKLGLIVLGDGPLFNDLKKTYGDTVVFPGFQKNVQDYLFASDFYVSASDGEGMPNTLLESMSVGLPVLLSDIPSHIEVLSKAEKSIGYHFNNEDVNELTAKMDLLLSLDYKTAEQEVHDVYSKYYTSQIMSEAYQKAYLSLF